MTKKTRYFMGGSAAVLVAGLGTGLVAFYGAGFPSLSASRSGPSELSYVPAESAVVAFANVREVMDSQLRQRLKLVLPQEQGQQEFKEHTGIDIERDIDYIVAAATRIPAANGSAEPSGLVIARGQFNTKMLEDLAVQHGGVIEEYKGKKLIKSTGVPRDAELDASGAGTVVRRRHEPIALAFLEFGLVGIGSEAAIKSAIDAQLTAHSITSNNEMMELIADIDMGNNAWAVGRFDAIASQAKLPPEIASKLPAIKTFAAMTHIDGGITGTLRAETRDNQSADNLRQVVQGLMALGRMTNDPKATALMNSLQLSGSGKTVALSFAVPSEVLDMIPQQIKKDGGHLHELPKQLHER
ncbi:MAG TPA: hypothetical protein VFK57_00155 [Vicinamibacterales bacterium]|nr:hypothetical protein [Vicinamibacterales bacterium]